MAYRKRDILSQGERAFWHPLQQAVGRRYLILCKVRLYDLAAVPANHPGEYRAFQQLARFHVDFVLCDPRTTTPLLAIELDDRSHRQRTTIKRDQYKDAVLRAARLPVYRVRCKQAYAPHEISVKIARMVERG